MTAGRHETKMGGEWTSECECVMTHDTEERMKSRDNREAKSKSKRYAITRRIRGDREWR